MLKTTKEISEILALPVRTVLKLARENRLKGAVRLTYRWRFDEEIVRVNLVQQMEQPQQCAPPSLRTGVPRSGGYGTPLHLIESKFAALLVRRKGGKPKKQTLTC